MSVHSASVLPRIAETNRPIASDGVPGLVVELLLGLTGFRQHVGALNEDARIDTQCPTDETEHDDCADPNSAAAGSGKATAPSTTPVFNSVALGQVI